MVQQPDKSSIHVPFEIFIVVGIFFFVPSSLKEEVGGGGIILKNVPMIALTD